MRVGKSAGEEEVKESERIVFLGLPSSLICICACKLNLFHSHVSSPSGWDTRNLKCGYCNALVEEKS